MEIAPILDRVTFSSDRSYLHCDLPMETQQQRQTKFCVSFRIFFANIPFFVTFRFFWQIYRGSWHGSAAVPLLEGFDL